MPFTDPYLAAQSSIPVQTSPNAAVWQPNPASTDTFQASGSDHTNSFSRSTMQDGRVVSTQTGGVQRTSNEAVTQDANRSANVPYTRAVDQRGSPVAPNGLQDDHVLTFPSGAQCRVAQARSLGWLQPANHLVQARQDAQREEALNTPYTENQTAKQEPHPDLKTEPFADSAAEQDFSAMVKSTAGMDQMKAIQQVIETGGISDNTLGALSSQLRTEPGALSERVSTIMKAAEQQARSVMAEGGLDSNAVVAWAQRHAPDKLSDAMNRQATMRQTSGYATLRTEYLETLAEHSPDLALNANLGVGISQRMDDKGRVIVRLPSGATMEWKSALRAFGVKKA